MRMCLDEIVGIDFSMPANNLEVDCLGYRILMEHIADDKVSRRLELYNIRM